MEYYNGQACVTVDELTNSDKPGRIMSYSNYKKQVQREHLTVERDGKGMGNYALIVFDSLDRRFRDAYTAKYGNPHEVLKARDKNAGIVVDSAARQWYADYVLDNGEHLDEDKVDEYTTLASILNEVIRAANETRVMQKTHGMGNRGISQKDRIVQLVEEYRLHPGHSLPTSELRILNKVREYKKWGYCTLIEGYLGRRNAQKICDKMGAQLVALKRSKTPRYTNAQIFVAINVIAIEKGWKELKSINTMVAYLNRPDIKPQWEDAVVGSKIAKNKYVRRHRTEMPSARDMIWYGDGTRLNLYYKKWDKDSGKWKMSTMMVYEVIDAYSEVFLGYHISETENYVAQCAAYRMAVENTQRRPYEIVTDNQGGHKKGNSKGLLARIARVSRPTAPDNACSKSIESVFGRFQSQVLSQYPNFTGMNITAKGDYTRPDMDFIQANPDKLPTLMELEAIYAEARDTWNSLPHYASKRPKMEMYMSSVNMEAQPITQADMIDLFWKRTELPSTFTQSGIEIQIDGEKYAYEVFNEAGMPDLLWRDKNTYRQFVVKYDPQDMTCVRLYTENAQGVLKFNTEARPYAKVHRALQDQQKGEIEFIRQIDEAQKQHRVDRYMEMVELEVEHGVAPEQHGYNRPKVCGISQKNMDRYMSNTTGVKREPTPRKAKKHIPDVRKKAKVEVPSVALMQKKVSTMTHDQIIGKW